MQVIQRRLWSRDCGSRYRLLRHSAPNDDLEKQKTRPICACWKMSHVRAELDRTNANERNELVSESDTVTVSLSEFRDGEFLEILRPNTGPEQAVLRKTVKCAYTEPLTTRYSYCEYSLI